MIVRVVTVLLLTILFSMPVQASDPASRVTSFLEEPVFGGQVFLYQAGMQNPELLVLVHGLGDEAGRSWDPLINALARDYHVVVPDLPGFGRSDKGNHLYSPENYAQLLSWLMGQLPRKPISLVGHSLGGAISLTYAAHYGGQLKRLILIDSVGVLHHLAVSQNFVRTKALDEPLEPSLGKLTDLILEKTTKIPFNPGLILSTAFLRQKFLAADPHRIASLAMVQADFSLLLDKVKTPTRLIWGEKDTIAPLRIAKALEWRLPQAELRVIPGAGHVPMKEAPEQVLVGILDGLRALPERKDPRVSTVRPSERIGVCEGQESAVFEGDYDAITIANCRNVELRQVSARKLQISDSEVSIEHAQFETDGSEPVVEVLRSRLTMTGVDVLAETGIVTEQSRLNLTGVHFINAEKAVLAQGNPSAILCSSSLKSLENQITGLHLSRTSFLAGESL